VDYLDWLGWLEGFVCPECGHPGGWAVADGRYKCASCGSRTSVTAGTLFDRRRSPLTVWFTACWMFTAQKDGVSALSLQRALEMGSYQTAWAMLHRLRSVLVRPGRERLTGTVEVDETYIGGEEPGLAGGRAKGKKALVGVAVEVIEPRGYGRCRMTILRDGSAASLHPFVTENVEPGATVITDGWQGYAGTDKLGYHREARSQRAARARGEDAGALLPGVHRVASLAQRWLLGTHQGRVDDGHLQSYLNEFAFRFNRRGSRSGGWSSTACSSSPSGTSPCATETWSSTPSPSPGRQLLPGHEATRRPWTGHAPGARGERPDLVKSAQMDFPNSRYAGGCGGSAACAGTRFGASGSPRRRITLRALRHPHRRRG